MNDDPDDPAQTDGAAASSDSLDVVRAEVDVRRAEQERRGDAFDTRAGLVIGFAGILIGLSVHDATLLQIIAQVVAVAAALAAGWSLKPRLGSGIGPRPLYAKYAGRRPQETHKALLETRIWLYEQDEKRLAWKVQRLRWAALLLVASVVMLLVSGIVEYVTASDGSAPRGPTPCRQERTHHESVEECYNRECTVPGTPGR